MLATNAADGQAVKTNIDALNTSSKNGIKPDFRINPKNKVLQINQMRH